MGLSPEQLPVIEPPKVEGMNVYPAKAQQGQKIKDDVVLSERSQTMVFMPTREGATEIPPYTVRWWDVEARQERQTTLAGRKVMVGPGVVAPPAPALPSSTTQSEERRPQLKEMIAEWLKPTPCFIPSWR